tara:strand:- start:1218 stop:1694 length:477 start_codon:yes stop_codon:yes gene_type:complete
MSDDFTVSDIVELGIQIEKNGIEFYTALAEKFKEPKVESMFAYLAREEANHVVTFNNILESIVNFESKEVFTDEYYAYMRSLASEYVFTQSGKGKELADTVTNQADAVDLAAKFELESIEFYEGIKKGIPDKQHSAIDALIAQEHKHHQKLVSLREAL